MLKINALGKPCPIPVVETKKALRDRGEQNEPIEVSVDNQVSVNNITKMTDDLGIETQIKQLNDEYFTITLIPKKGLDKLSNVKEDTVLMIGSKTLGKGDSALGDLLMKSYIYSLTELDDLPSTLIFFNEGAFLTNYGSPILADLKTLQEKEVTILTCGTCVDFYELKEKIAIGDVTNMFTISEIQMKADKVVTL
ncbi:sulfurtransferase-like selenium metabolism protein YedF [Tetragenococcus halophilus]|uniref:UPF0033 domain-containing protein n=1 Tax=Tetragenococcus halophilus (strain DSM 20338 / JCM 20259 / NCIMB 9735 / NBRC 12172) TaxID=945021 RepID=A0AAN1VQF4_TETHN|nr:sulfurtransferase-like selenium metabolism protein YedF [Tetragenococcus halophilus]QXN86494.1 sulfurtransferase-like selenium metabolism protein YedF [Tetragenococcus halophilus]BAK93949.1 hypothetical protein TEH_06220 [Tetragenococcus halophilus NBRC 12172]GBD60990.1 putative uncharacterized protein [Tetragenococcus halophilus subsp. halophilus]GBD70307.1 putative uncharacterized protein [Tetragenococcus halophilus subsp. halophilus]GBD72490.1 putative uncharacterized protein [Tetragenoc